MLRKIRASVSSFMELLKRFSLLFLNLRINPKQKISCLSLLFCFFTSHVLLLCSVLSLLYSSLSRSLHSLSIVGSGCWCFVVVASCLSVFGGSLERERERERER